MKRFICFLLVLTGIAAFSFAQTAGTVALPQEGIASYYDVGFAGKPTASGEIFDPSQFTAAHPTLPFGTILTVTNKQNMRQVTVRINDRGPFVTARIIDLSRAAAEAIDMIRSGLVPVILERALNTNLGPVAASASGVSTAKVETNAVEAAASGEIIPKETMEMTVPAETQAVVQTNAPPVTPQAYSAPAAVIRGGIPAAGSTKLYRLQVGAFRVPRNAIDVFEKLKTAGLNPRYEQNGDFYRVVLAGLKAEEIPSVAQILGNTGFSEAIIREEQ